jgi:hypothetical protein
MTSEAGSSKFFPEFSLPIDVSQSSKGIKNVLTETINKAVGTVAETADKAKETLTQTTGQAMNQVTQAREQAVGSVTQTAKQATGVLSETASKAVSAVKDSAEKAVGTVAETTEKAKVILNEATGQAVNQVTQATEQSLTSLSETTEQAKASITEMVQGTEHLTGDVADAIQVQLSKMIHNWLAAHPVISWAISHPLQTLGIVLLVVFLLRGLLKLLAQLIEKVWLLVLKSPFLLGQFLFRGSSKLIGLKRANELEPVLPKSEQFLSLESPNQQVQLAQLLQRIEEISQEQSLLLQKVTAILESNKQAN